MTNSIFVEVAIGLVLMYLIISLYCTIVQEWIAQIFNWRAKNLKATVEHLINPTNKSDPKTAALAKDVLDHPLFRMAESGIRGSVKDPSYVSSGNAVLALLTSLPDMKKAGAAFDFDSIKSAVGNLPEGNLRASLTAILDRANGEIKAAEDKLKAATDAMEKWFDDSMDRASGWYKRNVKCWLFGLGMFFAVLANADTVQVAVRLSNDANLRTAVVAYAATVTPASEDKAKIDAANTALRAALAKKLQDGGVDSGFGGLPIGWGCYAEGNLTKCYGADSGIAQNGFVAWIAKLLGILLTGLMASLGAPFWFGLLQKLNAVRASGNAPALADEKK